MISSQAIITVDCGRGDSRVQVLLVVSPRNKHGEYWLWSQYSVVTLSSPPQLLTITMVRRYMPTYRKSKKLGTRKLGESAMETVGGGETGRSGDRIPTAQWKEENSSRCQRFSLEINNQLFSLPPSVLLWPGQSRRGSVVSPSG